MWAVQPYKHRCTTCLLSELFAFFLSTFCQFQSPVCFCLLLSVCVNNHKSWSSPFRRKSWFAAENTKWWAERGRQSEKQSENKVSQPWTHLVLALSAKKRKNEGKRKDKMFMFSLAHTHTHLHLTNLIFPLSLSPQFKNQYWSAPPAAAAAEAFIKAQAHLKQCTEQTKTRLNFAVRRGCTERTNETERERVG